MKVQVIVTCINLWDDYTKPCIDSVINACKDLDYRILLIDNGSTDNTREEAGKLVSHTFSHHRNEEAWCCSKSWNFGIRDGLYRGFDHILVLNNDVLIHPESIKNLLARFKHLDNPAMVTMMNVRGEDHSPEEVLVKNETDYLMVPEAPHPDFSGFMIDRACFETVGWFDENFVPCYFEDNDYHRRIILAGLKAITLPTALFYHFGSRTQNEALEGRVMCPGPQFLKNNAYYVEKWGGSPGKETFTIPFNN